MLSDDTSERKMKKECLLTHTEQAGDKPYDHEIGIANIRRTLRSASVVISARANSS